MHLTVKRDGAGRGACGHRGNGGGAYAHEITAVKKYIEKHHYASTQGEPRKS